MLKPKATNLQTYTDGWGTSWEVSDRRLVKEKQKIIHFAESTVGMYRFWEAMIAGTQLRKAILVPERHLGTYYAIERYAMPVFLIVAFVVPSVTGFNPFGIYLNATAGSLADFLMPF